MNTLFTPHKLYELELPNRIVMAPMTRSRSLTESPDDLTAEYYAQRASAGLIITEGVVISQEARGYLWTPGIYTTDQIIGWKKVTDRVHANGGRIFSQLWHVGRMSHTSLQPEEQLPVSSVGSQSLNWPVFAWDENGNPARVTASPARQLTVDEIHRITEEFVLAAKAAQEAGFDGVELHAASGYLFDQFINGGINTRSDSYGGAETHNRLRFLLETVDAVIAATGRERVGVRISPESRIHDAPAYNDEFNTFVTLAKALSSRGIAYLHISEMGTSQRMLDAVRQAFSGTLILAGEYTREKAIATLETDRADLIAFGRPYIGNPDLVERFLNDWPLTVADRETYYGGGKRGYIDFPPFQKT
ncbi:alkene reductase [Enterobacter asburiae]|uniref:alkene reductase n=1 Tax=Enterobacter asburiae TaxID=61645 RepID=UPI0020066D38|nr:alkene reductase [Enterobacter asburiae]MCK7247707.1 alkene reductase [Enterobacter asburiae]MEB8258224.1 alkene reductase [Enterobacter asburiae]HCR2161406.1 alkene reductase [Enterobacter asburiae]